MTTKKRHGDGKKKAVTQERSLSELAYEMSTRRDTVESLLKDFALLLYGKSSGKVEWDGPDFCHLFYCESVKLTVAIKRNRFAAIINRGKKSSKAQLLNSVEELEAFLLKLYDERNKPEPKQRSRKKK